MQMIFAASSAAVRIGRPMTDVRQASQTERPVREACDERAERALARADAMLGKLDAEPVAEAIGREGAAGDQDWGGIKGRSSSRSRPGVGGRVAAQAQACGGWWMGVCMRMELIAEA